MQSAANPQSSRTAASPVSAWAQPAREPTMTAPASFLFQLALPPQLNSYYGAPGTIFLNYTVDVTGDVLVEVQLFNKTATRLGEAVYLQFAVVEAADSAWFAEVLGYLVDPLDVVVRGSQHQHGVGSGMVYVGSDGSGIAVDTVDTPVVSPWTADSPPTTLIVPFDPLNGPVEGMAAVLFANIYNTNFALYSVDDAMKMRFVVRAVGPSEELAASVAAARHKPQ